MLRVAFVLRSTEVQPVFSDLFTLTFNFLIENHWGSSLHTPRSPVRCALLLYTPLAPTLHAACSVAPLAPLALYTPLAPFAPLTYFTRRSLLLYTPLAPLRRLRHLPSTRRLLRLRRLPTLHAARSYFTRRLLRCAPFLVQSPLVRNERIPLSILGFIFRLCFHLRLQQSHIML